MKKTSLVIIYILCLLIAGCGTVTQFKSFTEEQIEAQAVLSQREVIQHEIKQRQRIADQVFELSIAAYPECNELRSHISGFDIISTDSIDDQLLKGANLMGVTNAPSIISIAAGSPAANAGLKIGDVIESINGESIKPESKNFIHKGAFYRATELLAKTNKLGKPYEVKYTRDKQSFVTTITPVEGCGIHVYIVRTNKPSPRANTNSALIPIHLLKVASNDTELSALTSFAIASVVKKLGVPIQVMGQQSNNAPSPYFSWTLPEDYENLKVPKYSVLFSEVESTDRYSVELLRRANMNPDGITNFWRKAIIREVISEKDNWGVHLRSLERLSKLDALSH